MAYADFTYYTTTFFGDAVPEGEFPKFAERASEYLDYITIGKASANPELDALKKACCAIAELYRTSQQAQKAADAAETAGGAIASESVGSWSRSYHSGADLAKQSVELSSQLSQQMYSVAFRYLAGTGLLYRGRGCV